jgi:hypothetical protein
MVVAFGACAPRGRADLPAPPPLSSEPSAEQRAVEAQPVCIASTVHSAGVLGPALFYRVAHRPGGRLAVGYYAFFSEERPWGNNWLTWSVVPAVALDLVYTRLFFVGPGLQQVEYGRGDVEGFSVEYDVGPGGRIEPARALADDDHHARAELSRADLFAVDPSRITLVTDTWSHHLGARVTRPDQLVYRRCYGPDEIRPLPDEVARRFHLERRALPAKLGSG